MGKITDAAVAVFVVIIGFFILDRMGITLPIIEHAFRQFFLPSSSTSGNNTTASFVFVPLAALSNSRIREKIRRKIEYVRRIVRIRSIEENSYRAKKEGKFAKR